ncbi:flagellar protein FlaG [Spongiibacter sp. IMCC21906]|jgi:flagellar protein FlaG|uniref:flagellar protein FlaG n=1 Tax=Spongiibacter sp. IMCC21906 TaxID=1620392 RepID=UPI00062DE026|nr:flagellar protein FlaG [Spongiibacter sp. IMCC21906]AKH69440.1 flagellar protein FlaG [Spongiibacter sp. IMCC21906]
MNSNVNITNTTANTVGVAAAKHDLIKPQQLSATSQLELPKQQTKSADHSRMALALLAEFGRADSIEKTEQAVAKLNEFLKDRERELEFSVDDATGRTILKVIHAESGEVIRQIPPEELLNVIRTFIEGTGSLIDEQA